MEVFLHKICGQPVQPPVSMQLRRCTPEQAPAVYALQNEVRAAMPDPEQFVPDTLENITAYVRKDLCIGAWQGSRLGGYLIVRFCGRSAHNYAAFMDVPRTEWEHWVNADSAIVHADFRGNGLQRLMLEAALPQPVSAMAETAEAARAAFRKLRREIMFRFFIVVTPFPERAANQKTRSLCGTGLKTKRPCPCVLSTRTGSVNTILRCHLACSASNTAEPLTESQHSPVL